MPWPKMGLSSSKQSFFFCKSKCRRLQLTSQFFLWSATFVQTVILFCYFNGIYCCFKGNCSFTFPRWLAEVWPVTGTPAVATVVLGVLAAVAALFIQLEVLVEMMSIGTCRKENIRAHYQRTCDCSSYFLFAFQGHCWRIP